jgi:iron complex outermembrane receptor protein
MSSRGRAVCWHILIVFHVVTFSHANAAEPQTDNNVVTAAEDAFGLTIGPESLGLYDDGNVRGFSPLSAGNARLDGLYFDKQGPMIDRLANDTRIRVGLSALDFPWPAPTGIVDYQLRGTGAAPALASAFYAGPFSGREVDLDGYTSFADGRGGLAAGTAFRHNEILPGETEQVAAFGVIPRWTPSEDLSVSAFWGRRNVTAEKTMPTVYAASDQLPPRIQSRYFGQSWAEADSYSEHYGLLVNAALPAKWILRAGVFHSVSDSAKSYADLYLDTQPNGVASRQLIGIPDQRSASTSGEVKLTRKITDGPREQKIDIGIRGRNVKSFYGGSEGVDAGTAIAGQSQPLPQPDFAFGPTTHDDVREWAAGVSYNVAWQKWGGLTVGLQRPVYSRDIHDPQLGLSRTSVHPWLYDASFVAFPLEALAVFGALTRGLEDSGVAPANAVNRGEILGAARTSQVEGGIRYALAQDFNLVAAWFEVRKPYFALNDRDVFVESGSEQHRGVELSLAGALAPGLRMVLGAVFLSPDVVATTSSLQQIGNKAVGKANRLIQLDMDYKLPFYPQLSLDAAFVNHGLRYASFDDRLRVPAFSTLDLGARYRFRFGQFPATLRVQVVNVTDQFNWYVADDGGLTPVEPRRALAYLTVDF